MDDINTTLQPTRPLVTTAVPLPDTISEGVQDYLAYRAKRGGVIHILSNFERLPEELEKTWFEEDPKWQEAAALLQKRIISYIQPLSRHVHAGAPLRLELHFTKEPPQLSPTPSAVVAVAAIDAKSGEAHHEIGRAEDLEHHPAAQSVALGLTLVCRSVEKGGDFWNMDNNQGGNPYRLEEVELRENAAWMAARNKYEGLGTPPFIGPAWAPPPLEGQKAMGLGVGGNGIVIAAEMPFMNQRANEPLLPHVQFTMPGGAQTTAELAAAAGAVADGRGNEEFFKRQREADAEFNKKQNESAKRWQEQNNEQQKKQNEAAEKNKLYGERLALTQRVQADLARVRENMAEISKNPQASEQLAALRIDEAELAGIPGAPPISQIAILNSNLELTDAAQDALEHDRAVTVEAQATAQKDSAEAAGVGAENSAKAAEKISAENFVVSKEAIQAAINYYNRISIPQGNRDIMGDLEPPGGPEAPEGGQEREDGTRLMDGSEDLQGRVVSVAGAGRRSAEKGPESGSINEQGKEEPVGGEVALREEEPEDVAETGIAEAGAIPPATQPQTQPTANATTEIDRDTLIAEQAQAIVEQQQARGTVPAAPAGSAADAEVGAAAQNVTGETGGSAVTQNAPSEGAIAAAPEQPEQPVEIQTQPAMASANRVQGQAEQVESVVGTPPEIEGQEANNEQRSQGGEGSGALATDAVVRSGTAPVQPETPTGIITEPASAPVGRVMDRADQIESVVGTPPGEVTAQTAAPARPGVSQGEENQDASNLALEEGVRSAVTQPASTPATVVPQQPQQPTQIVTPPASAPVDQTLERAEVVKSVTGEPRGLGGHAPSQSSQADAGVVTTAATATPVTPEQEITGQGAATGAAATAQGTQPQAATTQTPSEVVTFSPQTGEVVSEPAEAKTFSDVAAEAPTPTGDAATVPTDKANLETSATDREMADRSQQQHEEVGDLGLGARGGHDRVAEHLAAAAFAAPTAATAAAVAPAATVQPAAATAASTRGLAGPAVDRSQTAPSATDLSQPVAAGRVAAVAAAGVNAARNAGLNRKAELGERPLPQEAAHLASDHYAKLEKQPAPRTRSQQSSKQAPARVRKVVAKTAPATFAAIKPAARRKAAAASQPVTTKRAAAVRRQPPQAKAVPMQPRSKPAPAVMRTANGQRKAVAEGKPDIRRQKRQTPPVQGKRQRIGPPVSDIEPEPQ